MATSENAHPKRLYRSIDDRMLAGVAGGIAEYLDVDPSLIRIIMLLFVFTGVGILAYVLAWIIIPEDPNGRTHAHQSDVTGDLGVRAEALGEDLKDRFQHTDNRSIWGIFLIGLGVLFLIQTTFSFDLGRLWPLFLIIVGLAIVFGKGVRR